MNNITNTSNYLAHENELLLEHFNKTFLCATNKLDQNKLTRLYIDIIGIEGYINMFVSLFLKAIELHDLGKLSRSFQYQTLNNKIFNKYNISSTEHSLYSAFMYIDFCIKYVDDNISDTEVRDLFYTQIFLNSYVIRKHHSSNFGSKNSKDFNSYLHLFVPTNKYIDRLYTDEFKDYNMLTLIEANPSISNVKNHFFKIAMGVGKRVSMINSDDIDDYLSFLYNSLKEADIEASSSLNNK